MTRSQTIHASGSSDGLLVDNSSEASVAELLIEAGHKDRDYWQDLWRYRELFRALAWRDISVRYKQTAIGVAWAVVRPLLAMGVFTVVFGKIARLPSEGAPYPVLVFVGLLPWMLFSTALSDASSSLVANSNLISKVYFPRLIVPAAAMIVSLADFAINFGLLGGLLAWFSFTPSWHIFFLPGFVFLAFLAGLGPAFWIAAVNVKYRDFRYLIPFAIQFGLYISPVGFSSTIIPGNWRLIYSLNPMVGVIDGFRWSILGGESVLRWTDLVVGICVTAMVLLVGLRQFRKTEKSFADII